jgi:hypothetical protein
VQRGQARRCRAAGGRSVYELDQTVEGLCELARQIKGPEQHMHMWWSL